MISRVRLGRKFAERFVREAKKVFPLEHYAYLLGSKGRGHEWVVREVVWPEPGELRQEPEGRWVCPTNAYYNRALERSSDTGWELIGDLHSHCFEVEHEFNTVPSWQDFTRWTPQSFKVFGVCALHRGPVKIKRKITFWRVEPPIGVVCD